MGIIEFKSAVRLVGANGETAAAQLTGIAEEPSYVEAGLGHGQSTLAWQPWLRLRVQAVEPIALDEGVVVFPDGSRRKARFTPTVPPMNGTYTADLLD